MLGLQQPRLKKEEALTETNQGGMQRGRARTEGLGIRAEQLRRDGCALNRINTICFFASKVEPTPAVRGRALYTPSGA